MATTTSTPADVHAAPLSHEERSRLIRAAIRARSRQLRADHPFLAHQDAIGAGILGAAALVVMACAAAYLAGLVPWWVVVPVSAIAMSFAHEIEHDQIHRLYFARRPRAQGIMFAVCWLLRPYAISPWARRPLHLLHHEASGTERDIEEQFITNGTPWSPKRLVMLVDPLAAVAFRLPNEPAARRYIASRAARAYFPLGWIALAIWYSFLVLGAARLVTGGAATGSGALAVLWTVVATLTVTWIGPNVLRVACLHFISSNMHYFGDVEDGNVIEQTQVLDRWWLAPLQLFCCNFGSTHGIHHFVPGDPFYVRQMTAKAAHPVMREHGVRFNDLGTFRRANRFSPIGA